MCKKRSTDLTYAVLSVVCFFMLVDIVFLNNGRELQGFYMFQSFHTRTYKVKPGEPHGRQRDRLTPWPPRLAGARWSPIALWRAQVYANFPWTVRKSHGMRCVPRHWILVQEVKNSWTVGLWMIWLPSWQLLELLYLLSFPQQVPCHHRDLPIKPSWRDQVWLFQTQPSMKKERTT